MLNCIAIDDEPLALAIIEDYCAKIEYIELLEVFTSALQAIPYIRQNHIDLIFLDIQMPDIDGFEFAELLENSPNIIFTTAYNEHALKSYEYNTIDYLMKPFSFARFLKSIEKTREKHLINLEKTHRISDKKDYIFVYADSQTKKIELSEILYIKGMSDYIVVHTKTKKTIVKDSLRSVAERLSDRGFLRVHKSFIVSIDKIETIVGNILKINSEEIPIGKSFRDELLNIIKTNRIG